MINTRRTNGLGEVIRWAPLGPGGDPQMSLQGRRLGSSAPLFRAEVAADPRIHAAYKFGDARPQFSAQVEADPRFRAGYGLGAGAMSYGAGYGDYGDVVNVRGGRLGEVIRWAPLGPGGDPQMSLQGFGNVGLFGGVNWVQVMAGIVIGAAAYAVARQQKWVK